MRVSIAASFTAIIGAALFLFATASFAQAERRIALVIGNSAYKNTATLPNPRNDARAIGAALQRVGFNVDVRVDVDKRGFDDALRRFGDRLEGATAAVFFYAGHGLQVDGRNYLLPVDARLEKPRDLTYETIDISTVLREMEATRRVNLVFLDACRDNPLSRSLANVMGTRSASVGRGLAPVDAATGTLISYATKDGNVAADGTGRNSPFTTALLSQIEQPGLEVGLMLRRVREGVIAATNNKQVPWEYGSLLGEFYFQPGGRATGAAPPATTTPAAPAADAEIVFWDSIRGSTNPADFQAYLDQYPDGRFAALARNRVRPAPAPQAPTQVASVQPTLAPSAPPVLSGSYNVTPDASFPSRPIRIVVPYPPGGPTDIVARVLAQGMAESLGKPIVIENRAGAGGIIGSDAIAKAAPDGYSLLLGATATISVNPGMYSRMPYDAAHAFTPVAIFAESPQVLVVPANGPASVQDLISRARGGQMSFATGGSGTISHLTAELFKGRAGINLIHVPYKGTAPALTDLIAGQTQLMFGDPSFLLPHVTGGRLRALAVTSGQRHPQLGSVPTFVEAGVSGMEASNWYGMFAPAGTPSGVVSRLYQAVRQAVLSSDVASRLSQQGIIPRVLPPNDAQVFVQSETEKWGQVVRAAGVRAD